MDLTQFVIAGLRLKIWGNPSITLKELDPAYKPFLTKEDEDTETINIEIRVSSRDIPSTETLDRFFDSGQSWSMFRDNQEYWIAFHPPTFKQPLWLAVTNPDFSEVTVYCSDKLVSKKNGETVLSTPVRYPLDQILLMYILAQRGGVLVHAAGIEISGQGFIFPGKSGAGKSTVAKQFAACGQPGLLSDDRMAVRKVDGILRAFGTPWPGEAKIAVNKSVPLAGMFFIEHGSKNAIKEINPQAALERLLPVISVPWYDQETFPKILVFCEELIYRVPAYAFQFEPTSEAVDAFEAFVSKP